MEYPGSIFTKPLRRGLFLTFLTAFFVIAPLVLAYTAGYRYDWKNGLIRETGSLSIDVDPEEAVSYLNGVRLNGRMPFRIKNITPGKYTLLISAPGHHDWQKEIEVHNKQTTYIKEFRLIKKEKPELLVEGEVRNINVSFDGSRVLLERVEKGKGTLLLLNTLTKTTSTLGLAPSVKPWVISWSRNNNFATVRDTEYSPTKVFVVNGNANTPTATEITNKRAEKITKVEWKSSEEPNLYIGTPTKIISYQPATGQELIITNNVFLDWYVANNELWTITLSTTSRAYVVTKDALGFAKVASIIPMDTNEGVSNATQWRLVRAFDNEAVLKRNNSVWLSAQGRGREMPVNAFFVSPYNNWLLMWSPSELWTYAANEEPSLLTRMSETLQSAHPLDEHNTLAVIQPSKTSILFPYYFISHDFIDTAVTSFDVDTTNRIVYFAGKFTLKEGLWALNY